MARKRMISPELWENQSFGELSLLAKILFIGMISQADDDGKGILSPQLLKSRILPYDELRVADVDKALKEIGHNASADLSVETVADKAREERGHKLSVTYYVVGGKQYYIFDNWRKWQTICRPIPSKLPNPPMRGVGGEMTSHEVLNDNSMNTHGVVNERSDRIEDIKRKEKEEEDKRARAQVLSSFEELGCVVDCEVPVDLDMELLVKKIKSTPYLLQWKFLSKYIAKADKILAGFYDSYDEKKGKSKGNNDYMTHEYTEEQLQRVLVNFDEVKDEN